MPDGFHPHFKAISRDLFLWLMVAGFGLNFVAVALADDKGPVIPPATKGEQCVAETDFMRRNHMQLLLHQRDETVIRGIREEPFSLAECVDCHAQSRADGQPVRVDAEGQFCQSCHTYAAVKIDCFGCHAAIPDQAAAAPPTDNTDVASLSRSNPSTLTGLASYRHGKHEKN